MRMKNSVKNYRLQCENGVRSCYKHFGDVRREHSHTDNRGPFQSPIARLLYILFMLYNRENCFLITFSET